jgi:hypothetical protein
VWEFLWESERSLPCQKFPHILWNQKVHVRTHKSYINPVYTTTFPHSKGIFILYYHFSSSFPANIHMHVFFIHTCYKSNQFRSPLVYKPDDIRWGIQIIKFLGVYFFTPLCYRLPLLTKYSPQNPFPDHPHLLFLPKYDRPNFTHIRNKRHNYTSVYFNLIIFG